MKRVPSPIRHLSYQLAKNTWIFLFLERIKKKMNSLSVDYLTIFHVLIHQKPKYVWLCDTLTVNFLLNSNTINWWNITLERESMGFPLKGLKTTDWSIVVPFEILMNLNQTEGVICFINDRRCSHDTIDGIQWVTLWCQI